MEERHPALPGMAEVIYGKEPLKKSAPKKKMAKSASHEMFSLTSLFEESRVIHGFKAICSSLFSKLNFHKIIEGGYKDEQWNEILRTCVLSRIADPSSKKRTVENLLLDYNSEVPLEKVYRMMDRLYKNIDKVRSAVSENTLSLFNNKVDVLFFDVTTLYFESFTPDDLRNFGFSKDCKFKETQVVLALVTNSEGHPITYELFPGNTNEGTTLIHVVKSLKKNFKVNNATLVADRAMFTKSNLDLMDEEGINYIVAAKLKTFCKLKKQEITSRNYGPGVVCDEFHWLKECELDGRRLIVSYSKKRDKKDKADRQRLIDRLMKKVKNKQIPVSNLITNYGTKKYVKVEKTSAVINEAKVKDDELWDGLHGVITNIKDQPMQRILERYRGLWKIEQAFRINKHDLKMRPIYHWKSSRIQAHIAICFLAYALSCHMTHTLKQKGLGLSFLELRDHLRRDQYSIVKDEKTEKKFRLPSNNTQEIQNIYKAFGLTRENSITHIS